MYRIDIAARTCQPVLSTGLERGQLTNLNGRIAWIEPDSIRYVDEPESMISIDYPEWTGLCHSGLRNFMRS